jgi:ribonuclease HI
MGYNQEAYDAECAALARALETAARRQTTPEKVTIFTDAQAAIRCHCLVAPLRPAPAAPHSRTSSERSQKKWAEARQWAGGRVTSKKYKMPRKQRPDKTVVGSSKRHASRFYQLKLLEDSTG